MNVKRLTFLGLCCLSFLQITAQSAPRPYRISDHFAEEDLGSLSFAPGGQAIAFTRQRAVMSQRYSGLFIPEVLSDVWVQEFSGTAARNLTNGNIDSSGWWAPQWSPDGQRLAMLSSRGGEVMPWVWEKATGRVRQLSSRGIDFDKVGGCRWADARHLVCLALPEGERSMPLGQGGYHAGKGVEQAEAAWAKAKRGELSVSAVNSLEFRFPKAEILSIDVTASTERSWVERIVAKTRRETWWLSPTGEAIAAVKSGPETMNAYMRFKTGFPTSVSISSLDGRPIKLSRALPENIVITSMQWSPDGKELAFFALEEKLINAQVLYGENAREVRYQGGSSKDYPGTLWRVNIATGRVERWSTGDIDLGQEPLPPDFYWTVHGGLLFNSPRLTNGMRRVTSGAEPDASQWLVLSRDGRTRPLFKEAGAYSVQAGTRRKANIRRLLKPIAGGSSFLWLSEGEVRSVDPVAGATRNLTAALTPPVIRFEIMENAKVGAGTEAAVVLYSAEPRTEIERYHVRTRGAIEFAQIYLLEFNSGKITSLQKPSSNAVPAALAQLPPTGGNTGYQTAWEADDRTGAFLWRSDASGKTEQLAAANTFRQEISPPEERRIEYTTLNGESMVARLTFPHGYRQGQRVPLIVDSDVGYTGTNNAAINRSPNRPLSIYDMGWLAMGYAYMVTSWPVESMDQAGRANMLLGTNGVIPAVDEIVRQGIADPQRVFLFGWSSMGYGAYGLVTQTSRFKAAVIGAGWVDQITNALGLNMIGRYSDNPFYGQGWLGTNRSSFELPVWRNADHFRRNSPLSYVDRVQTPMMIIKGDMDGTGNGLTQDEMFFSALVQQRKPAEFVRYFGEGHTMETPANLRDMLQRIFAWYEQYGDIARDGAGNILYEDNGNVKSRHGAPPLKPEDFAKFNFFAPGGKH